MLLRLIFDAAKFIAFYSMVVGVLCWTFGVKFHQ